MDTAILIISLIFYTLSCIFALCEQITEYETKETLTLGDLFTSIFFIFCPVVNTIASIMFFINKSEAIFFKNPFYKK